MGGKEKGRKHSLLLTDGAGCRERSRLLLSDVRVCMCVCVRKRAPLSVGTNW